MPAKAEGPVAPGDAAGPVELTTGIFAALLVGAAIKLKLLGGAP